LEEVEKTGMNKSYKMIVLLYMLNRGEQAWHQLVTPDEVAEFFHHYLTEKDYRKQIDFSDSASIRLWEYNRDRVAKLITDMPMTKWSGSSKGLVTFEENVFRLNFSVGAENTGILHDWTKEICLYRLHYHFERRVR
jgi:hypothetical protein